MRRKQEQQIINDLQKKIVFVVGPRQVGKTWLAKEIGTKFENTTYLNYDHFDDQKIIKEGSWLPSTELLILDELHKMPAWKNHLKGIFDTRPENLKILVTGSARLDAFRQTGDSLAGRFFAHRLLPFSVSEISPDPLSTDFDRFLERGGFPEPFLSDSKTDALRWRNQYVDGLIRTDVLDFERIHDLKTLQTVFEMLRRRVGSPVSLASIARDVNASPSTVTKYVEILESLFIVFRVTPYSRNIARSILKEPKLYFYDNGLVVGDEGARFENFVAVSLLKHVLGMADIEGQKMELKYLRTKDNREIDFCLVRDDMIAEAIEAKVRDSAPSKALKYFCERYDLPGTQVVKNLRNERLVGHVEIRNAEGYLRGLFL